MHHIHHHYHIEPDPEVLARLAAIDQKLDLVMETIMSAITDLKPILDSITGKVSTVKTDVETLLAKLAAVPTVGLTPDQQAAIDAAVAQAQGIADSLGAIDAEVNP